MTNDKMIETNTTNPVITQDALAHLGDGREADGKTNKPDNKTNPALFATPHAMCVDSRGDFYVLEWVDFGRPRKFKHTPMA